MRNESGHGGQITDLLERRENKRGLNERVIKQLQTRFPGRLTLEKKD